MATLADMDKFASKDSEPLEWIVSAQPVIAVFGREGAQYGQHLGLPFNHNGESDVLLLWIGRRQKSRELLLTLSIRLKIGSERHTRKKSARKGRLMFLVVPVESLSLCSTNIAYHSLAKDESMSSILDLPSDRDSADCRVLKMSFDIGAAKSFVVMPSDPTAGSQPRQSMILLDKLKSLSEVPRFCLFANHDEILQSSVESVQAMLCQTVPMVTPAIELRAFYPGRRRAAINLWKNQGWHEKAAEEKKTVNKDVEAPPYPGLGQEKQTHDISPVPAYLPPVYTPRALTPSLPATDPHSSPPLLHSRTPDVCLSDVHVQQPVVNTSANVNSNAESHYERIFSSRTPPPPPPPDPSLSPNYTTDLLSSRSKDNQSLHLNASPETPAVGSRTEIPRTSSAASLHVEKAVGAYMASSLVTETPNRKRASAFKDNGVTKRNIGISASTRQLSEPPHDGDTCEKTLSFEMLNPSVPLSPTVLDPDSYRSMLIPSSFHKTPIPTSPSENQTHISETPTPSLQTNFTNWLVQAWKLCPCAHYIFVSQLLSLGFSVSQNDERGFHECRVVCTTSLLRHCASNSSVHSTSPKSMHQTKDLKINEHDIEDLVSWLYILNEGEELVFEELIDLAGLEKEGREGKDVGLRYLWKKAEIVGRAFVGVALKGGGGSGVLEMMGRERERCRV